MDLNKEPSLYHDVIDTKNCFSKRDSTSWNRFISFLPKEWIHSAHGSDTPYACDTGRAETNILKYPTGVANANNLRLFKTIHRNVVEFKTI